MFWADDTDHDVRGMDYFKDKEAMFRFVNGEQPGKGRELELQAVPMTRYKIKGQ